MKKLLFLFFLTGLFACKSKKNIPDVSGIQLSLKVERFENSFFAIDTNHISSSLDTLDAKYPDFLKIYLYNVLVLQPNPDSTLKYVHSFLREYKFVFNAAQQKFSSFNTVQQQLELACKYIKYYYPSYVLPKRITTFVGPIEGVASAITKNSFAIGLQSYLGKEFPAYQSEYISNIYPVYKSRKFEQPYIVVNCMNNIIDDMYPSKTVGKPLIEQMIEEGKRMYLLDAFLPKVADTLKTGYTAAQLQGSYNSEKTIWTFFIDNNLLYETEPNLIGPYVNDGPKTPELGDASPGNIGLFVGWQIVKKWMSKNEKKTLDELMKTPAKQIFEEAKYKP